MALTTNTKSQTSGVCNVTHGQLVTDGGTAAALTIYTGFAPRYIKLVNITAGTQYEWYEGMANANCMKEVTAGTYALDTSSGPTINADGSFTFPATTIVASSTFVYQVIG